MASYNFNIANTNPLPSPWVAMPNFNALRAVSNACQNANAANEDSWMAYSSSTSLRSRARYKSGVRDGGPGCCCNPGVNPATGYFSTFFDGKANLAISNGGVSLLNSSAGTVTLNANSVVECKRDGNDIVILIDDVEVLRTTNTVFMTGNPSLFIYEADGVWDDWDDGVSAAPTITNIGDESIRVGESVAIDGTVFGSTQGSGTVKISPSNNVADSGAFTASVSAWADTQITITMPAVSPLLTNMFAFVTNDLGLSNATGYTIQVEPSLAVSLGGLPGSGGFAEQTGGFR